jgi:hypothetical protein
MQHRQQKVDNESGFPRAAAEAPATARTEIGLPLSFWGRHIQH